MAGRCRMLYDSQRIWAWISKVVATAFRESHAMSLEYLLTTGALVIAFLTIVSLLMEALVASMAIKTFLFSLPVG